MYSSVINVLHDMKHASLMSIYTDIELRYDKVTYIQSRVKTSQRPFWYRTHKWRSENRFFL